jgi:hypothetical protein
MVLVWGAAGSRYDAVVPDGFEAGQGVNKYPRSFICCECNEGRVYGYEFRLHYGADLVNTPCINANGGAH